jgi:hypothetical protein
MTERRYYVKCIIAFFVPGGIMLEVANWTTFDQKAAAKLLYFRIAWSMIANRK